MVWGTTQHQEKWQAFIEIHKCIGAVTEGHEVFPFSLPLKTDFFSFWFVVVWMMKSVSQFWAEEKQIKSGWKKVSSRKNVDMGE